MLPPGNTAHVAWLQIAMCDSGEVVWQRAFANPFLSYQHYCYFRRPFTAAYFEMHTGRAHYLRNVRSGCTNSLIPADGVLSSPRFSVGCV